MTLGFDSSCSSLCQYQKFPNWFNLFSKPSSDSRRAAYADNTPKVQTSIASFQRKTFLPYPENRGKKMIFPFIFYNCAPFNISAIFHNNWPHMSQKKCLFSSIQWSGISLRILQRSRAFFHMMYLHFFLPFVTIDFLSIFVAQCTYLGMPLDIFDLWQRPNCVWPHLNWERPLKSCHHLDTKIIGSRSPRGENSSVSLRNILAKGCQ